MLTAPTRGPCAAGCDTGVVVGVVGVVVVVAVVVVVVIVVVGVVVIVGVTCNGFPFWTLTLVCTTSNSVRYPNTMTIVTYLASVAP